MRFFPPLQSGSICQAPASKGEERRAVYNDLLDGTRLVWSDAGSGVSRWRLSYDSLTDSEAAALTELHSAVDGQLGEFGFLDPFSNLLTWSEDLTQAIWMPEPLLHITKVDGQGTFCRFRLVNSGQIPQRLEQRVSVPANFPYCFSVYARSEQQTSIVLSFEIGGWSTQLRASVDPTWRRLVLSDRPSGSGVGLTCSLTLLAGDVIEIWGCQLDAQGAPSSYRPSFTKSGVRTCRFGNDVLSMQAQGLGRHSAVVELIGRITS